MIGAVAIILVQATGSEYWNIPACQPDSATRLIGEGLALRVPKNAKTRRSGDIDFQCVAVRVPATTDWITACAGGNYTSGTPSHLRKTSLRTEERLIRWPNMETDWDFQYGPRDVKGEAASGRRWRYIGIIGASIQYDVAGAASAARADALMETLCWAKP